MDEPRKNASGPPIDFDKMAEFDALPRPIRLALAGAPRSFNPRQVREHWQRSGLSAEAYVARVVPEMITKQLRLRPWHLPAVRDQR